MGRGCTTAAADGHTERTLPAHAYNETVHKRTYRTTADGRDSGTPTPNLQEVKLTAKRSIIPRNTTTLPVPKYQYSAGVLAYRKWGDVGTQGS